MTVGATATFNPLVSVALSPDFLRSLREHGFTNLLIQYGQGSDVYEELAVNNPPQSEGRYGIIVDGFDFNKGGLNSELQIAKGTGPKTTGNVREGVVISHAGRICSRLADADITC